MELLRTFDASYPEHNDGVLDSGSEALITNSTDEASCWFLFVMDERIALWDLSLPSVGTQVEGNY